jgi:hypothetical protein
MDREKRGRRYHKPSLQERTSACVPFGWLGHRGEPLPVVLAGGIKVAVGEANCSGFMRASWEGQRLPSGAPISAHRVVVDLSFELTS